MISIHFAVSSLANKDLSVDLNIFLHDMLTCLAIMNRHPQYRHIEDKHTYITALWRSYPKIEYFFKFAEDNMHHRFFPCLSYHICSMGYS